MSIVQWLHRYIFRGIGLLFVIGLITLFILMVNNVIRSAKTSALPPVSAPAAAHR
jgi:hypothetical protein